ncbi:MAG: sulfur oxidation protein SoxCD [Arcobacter sp.]|uniref:c-type cytochrome n=1 Tax=uncultured Arcobacter sp. TaxID=165434 RepID=UPI000CC78A1D|nr:c-type cytochrome [uncultured Arcobacter sp.]PLY11336.1 MAG: sulfur oxidation protein SoxCD [Arcobacter sp.]
MFKLENTTKKLKTTLLTLGVTSLFASSLLANGVSVDGAVKYPTKDGKYGPYHVNTQDVKYNNGREATKNEINIWNIDVKPDLKDLPKYDTKHGKPVMEDGKPKIAKGSAEWGEELYDKNCGMCHGEFGAGGKGYPTLSGGKTADLVIQRLNPADKSPNASVALKTVGSYWPYASTLFWYIQDSMPFTAPKTLTNSEVYAITAFLLSVNEIEVDGEVIDEDFVLSKENFNKIVMPNVDGFYPEVNTKDPQQGVKNMTELLSNPKIYGTGTRCMNDCIKGDVKELLMRIKVDLAPNANQPITAERSWKEPASENSGEDPVVSGNYDTYCSACHSNKAIGAPVIGDKGAWTEVMSKGIDTVYENAINGINAMPPKGGTVLSDEEFKQIVDYMINSSK